MAKQPRTEVSIVRWTALLLLSVGLLLAVACDADGGAEPTATPTAEAEATETAEAPEPTPTPAVLASPTSSPLALTYEQFVSPRLGYRIEIPEEWITVEDFPIEFGGEAFLADLFLVPVPERGFSANVNVVGVPAQGATFDQVIALERAYIRENSTDIREGDLVIGGHNAKVIHSTSEEEGELLDFSQVFLVIDDTEWALTLTTLPGERDRYLPIFEHIYDSFRP